MRLVRYADDFVIMIHGSRGDAEALREEVAAVLAPMGLRLSATKTRVCHIDEGFDFLGWRIQRRVQRNQANNKKAIYTYPSKKALASIVGKVRRLTRRAKHRTLSDLLRRLNPEPGGLVQPISVTESPNEPLAIWITTPTARVVTWLKKTTPRI